MSGSGLNIIRQCLVVNLPEELDENIIGELTKNVFNFLPGQDIKYSVFDFASIDVIDSYEFNKIMDLLSSVQLLGIESAIAGIQPGVAAYLIDVNIDVKIRYSFLNVEQALSFLTHSSDNPEDSHTSNDIETDDFTHENNLFENSG